ncbi:DNA ligase D [Marinibaculum pumilum]|uniref:DNA ligase (ATP) n=1 Tax=Marinibaculum pumilum TaxID=1766165 RepID=A0ABV7L1W8_9PROT
MATRQPGSALDEYNRRRDFRRTAEPAGKAGKRRAGRRNGGAYLIQKHDASRLHYDFRLELDGVLKSWAVTRGPSLDPKEKRLAVRTEDHPLAYGDFEGVIPEGEYGGGTVMLWDRGTWESKEDPAEGLKKGKLSFHLHGERLTGDWALVRMRGKKKEKRENWLLVKERDDAADASGGLLKRHTDSVASGRTMAQIAKGGAVLGAAEERSAKRRGKAASAAKSSASTGARGKARPTFVAPQLATLVDAAPQGGDWLHEIKWDGYRIQAILDGGRVRLMTRNRKDWSGRFPAIRDLLQDLPATTAVIDGEVVALSGDGDAGDGMPRSDFAALQQAMESGAALCYVAFDLLHRDGADLRKAPLHERKAALRDLLGEGLAGKGAELRFCDHLAGEGPAVHAHACELGLEGIVSKRADRPYRSGRGRDWLKAKCARREEFVIAGFSPSDKKGRPFASLLLGTFEGGDLVYRGRVGTGFDGDTMTELAAKMRPLARKTAPFDDVPAAIARTAHWVTPKLVAQIAYTERTPDGLLRHPAFQGLREDKAAEEVHLDRSQTDETAAAGDGIALTHPDRVLFPEQGITKGDLAGYLAAVADHILPHLAHRPLSLVRCPQGRAKACFFQRHRMPGMPDAVHALPIVEKDGTKADYLYVEDAAGLRAMAQFGVLELHIWGAPAKDVEKPDRLVFDLDPDEGLGFAAVRAAARDMRDLLAALGLQSFPLLTGGKGVHVVVPLTPVRGWEEVKGFARGLSERLAQAAPDRFVAKASKQARKGRIFLDWLRNERGATAICPFSARARKGAPVAVPVSWDELARASSGGDYDMAKLRRRLGRLKADPWAGYFDCRQKITAAALKAVADPQTGGRKMAKDHGPQVKKDKLYEDLRDEGMSKEKAARIANAKANPKQQPSKRGGKAPPYEDWSKQDLYERAKELDVDGRSKMDKGALIKALRQR